MSLIQLLMFFSSFGLLLVVIELVRRKHLREKYSLIWLLISLALITISLFPGVLDFVAIKVGISYGPSLLFVAGIFALILLSIMLSVIVSHQTTRIIGLVQNLGLLEKRVRDLESNQPADKKPVKPIK